VFSLKRDVEARRRAADNDVAAARGAGPQEHRILLPLCGQQTFAARQPRSNVVAGAMRAKRIAACWMPWV
jgi:hypothetical protein